MASEDDAKGSSTSKYELQTVSRLFAMAQLALVSRSVFLVRTRMHPAVLLQEIVDDRAQSREQQHCFLAGEWQAPLAADARQPGRNHLRFDAGSAALSLSLIPISCSNMVLFCELIVGGSPCYFGDVGCSGCRLPAHALAGASQEPHHQTGDCSNRPRSVLYRGFGLHPMPLCLGSHNKRCAFAPIFLFLCLCQAG